MGWRVVSKGVRERKDRTRGDPRVSEVTEAKRGMLREEGQQAQY